MGDVGEWFRVWELEISTEITDVGERVAKLAARIAGGFGVVMFSATDRTRCDVEGD